MSHGHLPTRLFLLRHAEVEERYHRIFGGRIDMQLSDLGHRQARALADYLSHTHLDAIYVSPMKRAQQTLSPVLQGRSLEAVTLPSLREVDFGDWTGLSWEGVHAKFGVSAFNWLKQMDEQGFPSGDSASSFRDRVEPCLKQVLHECAGKSVGIVCHGGVVRMLLALLLDVPLPITAKFEVDYASVTRVDHRDVRSEMQFLNFTPWRDLP